MYQIFFEMEMLICERFPAFTPISLRKERAVEVLRLVSRLGDYDRRKTKEKNEIRLEGGIQVIRRPAGDNWF